MATEQESQAQQTDDAIIEAAMLAEMAVPEEGSDVQAPAVENQDAPESKPDAAADTPAVVERKEVLLGMTEEELRAKLDKLDHIDKLQKAVDTTAGTLGSRLADQQRAVEELRNQRQQLGTFSKESLTRLSKEYPEIAEMLAQDLSEAITQVGGKSSDPAQIEEIVSTRLKSMEERLAQKELALEVRDLTRTHPDWREVAVFDADKNAWSNQAFGNWIATQPPELAIELRNSVDADFISKQLSAFKQATKKTEKKQEKQQQLEAAVMPQGSNTRPSTSEADEEQAAFRAEMARR